MMMDIVYIGAIAAFLVMNWALVVSCDKLGGRQ